MAREIKSYAVFKIDDREVIILGDTYVGTPLIAYEPDILIVPKAVFKKYAEDCFLFLKIKNRTKTTKIIKI